MSFEIKSNELQKAIGLIEDHLFKTELDSKNTDDLKLLKLLQARESNRKFEYDLAEMVCGEDGHSFPKRTSYFLTEFFQNLGFRFEHDGSTKRFWVEDVLKQLNIRDIAKVVRKGLFNKRDFRTHAKKFELNFDELYESAIQEFKTFIEDSIHDNEELDLAFLLNMNVNTDLLFNERSNTTDKELNELIRESKDRFLNPKDKHIALEKIWDAFERIKTYYDPANKKNSSNILVRKIAREISEEDLHAEFKTLTIIGNTYRIRHHEKGKKEIKEEGQIEYLYFRVLTLIDLCVRQINED